MSKRVSVKTITFKKKPNAYTRSKAARSVVVMSNRAPSASRGFNPQAGWKHGKGMRGETKAVDIATTTTGFTLNAAVAAIGLNFISAGSSFFNRIGRKIALKNLYFNAQVANANGGVTNNEEYLRVIIVYDSQTNGALPIFSDIVQATTQAAASSSLTMDGFNLNNRDRFKIVLDKRFHIPEAALAAAAQDQQFFAPTMEETTLCEFRKLNNLETQYKADSAPAVIGDVATGGLFLVTQGTIGGQYNLIWTCRVRYTDN